MEKLESSVSMLDKLDNADPFLVIGHLIRLTQQVLNANWSDHAPEGLTTQQLLTLYCIELTPKIDQSTLVQYCKIDRTTMMGLVRNLTDRKFIKRLSDPNDGRRSLFEITAGGARCLAEAVKILPVSNAKGLAGLSKDEVILLVSLLLKILDEK